MTKKELLIVLSSPSGGGKTTICELILKKHKECLRSVSATTRKRRKGERQGVDYLFMAEEEFKKKIKAGQFIEWAWVHGNRYGTPKQFVTKVKKAGKTAFFVLDVQGGMAMKRKYPECILIFILPPSIQELERRLIRRGTEGNREMKARLKTALKEIGFWSKYDYVVINRRLDQTMEVVENIIQSERAKSKRFDYPSWSGRRKRSQKKKP